MTTEEMVKFGYEKMVKNNPDEAIKELIRLNNLNDRIYKAIRLIHHNDIYDYSVFEEKLLNILQGSE